MNKHETILLREAEDGSELEIPVVVEYTFNSACLRKNRTLCGGIKLPSQPELDEPASVEIGQVWAKAEDGETGSEIDDVTEAETEKIENEIMEQIADRAADYPED